MMLKKSIAILSFATLLFSCTNDVPKPSNQANNQEKNISGENNVPDASKITPDMLKKDILAIESFSQGVEDKIKELDSFINKLPKEKANIAQPFLEEIMGMQEKSIGMRDELVELKAMVKTISQNPEAYKNAGNVDGGPLQVQSALDGMKVTSKSIQDEIDRYETEIRKIGG